MVLNCRITIGTIILLFGTQPISCTSCSLWGSSFIAACVESFVLCDEYSGVAYYSKYDYLPDFQLKRLHISGHLSSY